MKLLLRSLLLFCIPLLFACSSGCNSLPPSAYGKAQLAKEKIEPVVMAGLVIVAEQQVPQAQAAFDALARVLDAWREADQGKFNSAVPCASAAVDELARALPNESKALDTLQKLLKALSGAKACEPEDDAGSASQAIRRSHETVLFDLRMNPLPSLGEPAETHRFYVSCERTAPLPLCERDPENRRCKFLDAGTRIRPWA